MRLLNKINRNFLWSSMLLFAIATIVFYFVIYNALNDEMTEGLYKQEKRLVKLLEKTGEIPDLYPYYRVDTVDTLMEACFSDTLIPDPEDNEMEPYRELHTYRQIRGQNYHIVVRASSVENEELILLLLGLITGILLLTLAGLYFTNRKINRQVWKPFYQNLQVIKGFSMVQDDNILLQESSIKEFKELNTCILDLTEKVKSDYIMLKQFTENAAHEMQTPLSILKVRMESLLNEKEVPQSMVNKLADIDNALTRLISLNKKLLELAKIENQQYDDIKAVDFNALIEKVLDDQAELIQLKNLNITTQFQDSISFQMDPRLAELLVTNLTGNALNHCTADNKIIIEIAENQISFFNSGEKRITEDHRIYERFYKENASSRSTGLGLSIVKMICDMNRIKVTYDYVDKMHVFKLNF